MLILTRNIKETLIIGDDVRIKVLGVKGNQVRLGIDAPESTSVHREEVYNRIQEERNGYCMRPNLISKQSHHALN